MYLKINVVVKKKIYCFETNKCEFVHNYRKIHLKPK